MYISVHFVLLDVITVTSIPRMAVTRLNYSAITQCATLECPGGIQFSLITLYRAIQQVVGKNV